MRLKDAVEFDLSQVFDYVPRTFGVEIEYGMIKAQLEALVEKKVEDYIHQRYRDWAVKDLLTALIVLEEKFKKADKNTKLK